MNHFPLFADLTDRRCLVVGGGDVAARKARRLLAAGAAVTINAPLLGADLASLAETGRVEHVAAAFDPALVASHWFVIAATSQPAVNAEVARAAADALRFCNVVDDGETSSAIVPAVVDRSPIVIAVSSGGHSPVLARRLRQQIEAWLPDRIGPLAEWAGSWRDRVGERIARHADRLRFWERALEGAPARALLAGDTGAADQQMHEALGRKEHRPAEEGAAWFVGAGPGDPGLLTRRGLQLLQAADVVLYDRLIGPQILEFARRDAQLVGVGKSPRGPSTSQDRINALLLAQVSAGKRVCRLKGGDPFVFGRGAEEVAQIARAGLAYEVVPGITAATGCAAAAGISLTHRDHAHAVTLITAHRKPGAGPDPDWAHLARCHHTLAVYMGVRQLAAAAALLIEHGRAPDTPAALVENGTLPDQRVIGGQLDDIAARATTAGVQSPALLIVGDVVAAADTLRDLPEDADPVPALAGTH